MKPIQRKHWAIAFRSGSKVAREPFLIFESWDDRWFKSMPIPNTPSRPLMFGSRRIARAWCAEKRKKWDKEPLSFGHWHVWPVRVVETITPI
jgi:hypothetical protein